MGLYEKFIGLHLYFNLHNFKYVIYIIICFYNLAKIPLTACKQYFKLSNVSIFIYLGIFFEYALNVKQKENYNEYTNSKKFKSWIW